MAKPNKKKLVKMIKTLNKTKLADKITTSDDLDDMVEDFITAIEEIDDNKKIDKVPDDVIDFYEGLIPDTGGKGKGKGKGKAKDEDDDNDNDDDDDNDNNDDDDDDDDLSDLSLKDLQAKAKELKYDGKVTKKNRDKVEKALAKLIAAAGDDDDDDNDNDDNDNDDNDDDDLSDLSLKDLQAKAKEIGYKEKITKKNRDKAEKAMAKLIAAGGDNDDDDNDNDDNDDDNDNDDSFDLDEADAEEIVAYCKANKLKLSKDEKKLKVKKLRKVVAKLMKKAEKKTGKVGKKDEKPDGLPKGLRQNTLPAEIYTAISEAGEKGAAMKDLAKIVADSKNKGKKKAEKKAAMSFYGFVQRTIARKIAKSITIVQIHATSGMEGDAIFKLATDDSE